MLRFTRFMREFPGKLWTLAKTTCQSGGMHILCAAKKRYSYADSNLQFHLVGRDGVCRHWEQACETLIPYPSTHCYSLQMIDRNTFHDGALQREMEAVGPVDHLPSLRLSRLNE